VMSVSVCLSVCLSVHDHRPLSWELHAQFSPIFVHVAYRLQPWSVLLWRRSDTVCTSGFMDDVILADKPRLFDVAALKRSAHAALGLAINCAQ